MTKLNVLEDLKELTKIVFKVFKAIPDEYKYSLRSQLINSMISVRLNIREGNVFWDANKIRHFRIALGSLEETDENIEILKENDLINSDLYKLFKDQYYLCRNKLTKLIKSLVKLSGGQNR